MGSLIAGRMNHKYSFETTPAPTAEQTCWRFLSRPPNVARHLYKPGFGHDYCASTTRLLRGNAGPGE